jgi:hypothetical protein
VVLLGQDLEASIAVVHADLAFMHWRRHVVGAPVPNKEHLTTSRRVPSAVRRKITSAVRSRSGHPAQEDGGEEREDEE